MLCLSALSNKVKLLKKYFLCNGAVTLGANVDRCKQATNGSANTATGNTNDGKQYKDNEPCKQIGTNKSEVRTCCTLLWPFAVPWYLLMDVEAIKQNNEYLKVA